MRISGLPRFLTTLFDSDPEPEAPVVEEPQAFSFDVDAFEPAGEEPLSVAQAAMSDDGYEIEDVGYDLGPVESADDSGSETWDPAYDAGYQDDSWSDTTWPGDVDPGASNWDEPTYPGAIDDTGAQLGVIDDSPYFPETTIVEPGESLSAVAARIYGDPNRWPEIYAENRDVLGPNPNFVPAGVELTLPDPEDRLSRAERNSLVRLAAIPERRREVEPEPYAYGIDADAGARPPSDDDWAETHARRVLAQPREQYSEWLPDSVVTLRRIDNGELTVDPNSRLGAYAATAGYADGTVGATVHRAIGTIYGALGTVGEEQAGAFFNSPEAQALLNQPASSAATRQLSELEYAYWDRVRREKPDAIGGYLGSALSPRVREVMLQQVFGRMRGNF